MTEKKQTKWNREWRIKNPERAKYIRYRNSARTFARHWATKEDMDEINEIYKTENKNER